MFEESKSNYIYLQFQVLHYRDTSGLSSETGNLKRILRKYLCRRRFLGLAGWYMRFVEKYAAISYPLTELLKKQKSLDWNPKATEAFTMLKSYLTAAPILITPNFSKPFIVICDACTYGIGCVSTQIRANSR